MAEDRNKISEAYVDIYARLDRLEADLDRVRPKVDEVGDAGEKAGKKAEGGFEKASKSVTRMQEILSKLAIPALFIGSVLRATTAIVNARKESEKWGEELDKTLDGAKKQLEEFRRDGLSRVEQEYRKLAEAQRSVNEQIDKLFEQQSDPGSKLTSFVRATGELFEQLSGTDLNIKTRLDFEADAEETKNQAATIFNQLRSGIRQRILQEERDASRAFADRLSDAKRQIQEIEAAQLQSQGKIDEAVQKRREVERSAYEEQIAEIQAAARQYEQAFGRENIFAASLQATLEAAHKQRLAQIDIEADKIRKRYADAMKAAFEEAAATLNQTLAGSFGSFTTLSDAARDIANAIDRRR